MPDAKCNKQTKNPTSVSVNEHSDPNLITCKSGTHHTGEGIHGVESALYQEDPELDP